MRGLQPVGPGRTTLEVIIPSQSGLSLPSGKKQLRYALDWPSNYSLLRLWHTNGSLQKQKADCNNKQHTVTCLPPGLYTIKCLQSVSCLEDQQSLLPRPHCKQTYGTLPSQIDDYDRELLQLPWGPTKLPWRHCMSAGGRLPLKWLYWILYCPLLASPLPL